MQWDQVCIAKGHWLQYGGRTDKALQSQWRVGDLEWGSGVVGMETASGGAVAAAVATAAAAADGGYENGGGDSAGKGGSGKNYCYIEA